MPHLKQYSVLVGYVMDRHVRVVRANAENAISSLMTNISKEDAGKIALGVIYTIASLKNPSKAISLLRGVLSG